MQDLKKYVRNIPDFPKKGIVFRDITTLIGDAEAFRTTIDMFYENYKDKGIDAIVGIDARGFIFGAALAYKLGVKFVPVRKKGKLPFKTYSVTYALEYGTDTLEMHEDAVNKGSKVLIMDDLLATGGTAEAVVKLVEMVGAEIAGIAFVIELEFLKGAEKLKSHPILSLIKYNTE